MYEVGKEKVLSVNGRIVKNGIAITVKNRDFVVEYPTEIWQQFPTEAKEMLRDNLVFGDTHFLPLTLGYTKIKYNTKFPMVESFLFQNQIMDMTKSESWDKVPTLSYLKQFHNLEYDFAPGSPAFLKEFHNPKVKNKQRVVIVPFSFGKESLLSVALCLELGIKPILVYSQEPSMPYEEAYKRKKLAEFGKKFNVETHFVKNGPGLFRYDAAFSKKKGTEVGWASQTTLIALQVLPFVYAHNADYIFFGSEYLNNEYKVRDGWKVFYSYDQSSFFTLHQDSMIRLLTKGSCRVKATLEPIDQINIFEILHRRYPEIGVYQFSCAADHPLYKDTQWCHRCYKCARMYLFARVINLDPATIGFKKDLLNQPGLFENYFGKVMSSGNRYELDVSFYTLYKRGDRSHYVKLFEKTRLKTMAPWKKYYSHFTTMRPWQNLPEEYASQMLDIFQEELDSLKKLIPKK